MTHRMTPRCAILAIALGLAFASYALPQESAAPPAQPSESAAGDPWIWWKWGNFAILALGIGYLVGKHVPPLFRKQSEEIHAALVEAAKMKEAAAAYAASIEARLSSLQREIETLRQSARAEMTAEGERLRHETERHLQRIREQSQQEIELMTRGAKDALRKYAAELSIGLAEQRIRDRMTPAGQENLVSEFLHDLHDHIEPRAASN